MLVAACVWTSHPGAANTVLSGTGESFLSTRIFFSNGDLALGILLDKLAINWEQKCSRAEEDIEGNHRV